ncbi:MULTISPECIES: nicotinate-nucleotide adenylyltransferase [Methylomonas]|uniref:Probable nicotinate-nucleotide adenylyltransferase n=2 Tax=Methylomonas TaxID=416 RepID=A0A126T748_9GAMM|nr:MULTISPECIES: nicotinate-nucleotide adenylyltransferase [Methylomonas]AMK77915.1 nicotinic acid mononucleotide adenylyltransferase [Methylomonas denitrificans]OAI08854.1 nicotinate-nicotinamide nucleotide adenylyltransferase [Methylomonas methanica]TCV85448.1 nicotinate-nucleotide adenylyltransferase [Methylomonas methanica]
MIGVYGGTFNPVHYGHLRTALEVKELFELEQLRLIPCRLPPHRDEPEVPAHLRLQMLEAAVAETYGFSVDRRELDRAGPSYMVDTLHSLRNEIGDTPMLLFIGADAFAGLERWYQWQRLFEYAHVVVMTRPGYAGSEFSAFFQQRFCADRTQLSRQSAGFLTFQQVTALDISATAIRELVAAGRDPQFLLPDRVIELIRRHHLYQTPVHHTGN